MISLKKVLVRDDKIVVGFVMSLSIIKYFTKLYLINILYTNIRSLVDEHKFRKNLKFYTKKKVISYNENDISTLLIKRLSDRGLNSLVKKKGDLHVFITYPLLDWEDVLLISLRTFGQVTVFNFRPILEKDGINGVDREIISEFDTANEIKAIDIVIGYLSGSVVTNKPLIHMANKGARLCNFCFDDKLHFPGVKIQGRYNSPASIAKYVDINLTNSRDSISKYLFHEGLAIFWPEGAEPSIHKPNDLDFQYDVSFVGRKYGWREIFIRNLKKLGIEVKCFGQGWENGPLSKTEMINLYSRSRINLGFGGVGFSKRIMCLKGRDFEIPMSGGLYLTQNNPELALVYKLGEEILVYDDEKHCAHIIKSILNNQSEAEKIRKAGRNRALHDHTWEIRFAEVFKLFGFDAG